MGSSHRCDRLRRRDPPLISDQDTPSSTPFSARRPAYVKACCERSLNRLETDVIDLYYIHRVDPTVPIEDTVGAMSDLVPPAESPSLSRSCFREWRAG